MDGKDVSVSITRSWKGRIEFCHPPSANFRTAEEEWVRDRGPRKMFEQLDLDQSGSCSRDEIMLGLNWYVGASPADASSLFDEIMLSGAPTSTCRPLTFGAAIDFWGGH